jgi:hypothetical protein
MRGNGGDNLPPQDCTDLKEEKHGGGLDGGGGLSTELGAEVVTFEAMATACLIWGVRGGSAEDLRSSSHEATCLRSH